MRSCSLAAMALQRNRVRYCSERVLWRREMLVERIEGKWVQAFKEVFTLCAVKPGEIVAILSETQSRAVLVELSQLALHVLGARVFHVQLPTPPVGPGVPLRSTGTSFAVEGMLHSKELPRILAGSTRLMMISNEQPEVL